MIDDGSLDSVFHALADPTRRRIVTALRHGPASVSTLAAPLDMTLSAVMQHLQVLMDCGLVTSAKTGRVRTCTLDTGVLRNAETWLGGHMIDSTVLHSSFTVERGYPHRPGVVFAAWADPASKARWFGGEQHILDFRVGGREIVRDHDADGRALRYETRYHDIVPGERIVYSSTLLVADVAATISLTSVQFRPTAVGTMLRLTEQAVYLDEQERPAWREQGTNDWLDALALELD
ncbi:metalloregulator ArsR/SmtB family transcription factor [Dactylosporangium sp. NPDC051541]|uniref:metalloregulator ArsR/SmtB family transcription factor n=1 Tax=Dactylosporangium sp. NPDC051541 TaxID=3363977 RepID=UPI0037A33E0E